MIENVTVRARSLPLTDGVTVKWTAKQGYHVTIRFIGEMSAKEVPNLVQRMHRELAAIRCGAFSAQLKGCGSFPAKGRPRILWAGLDSDCMPFLSALRQAADTALGLANTVEEELHPHVTVARCNVHKKNPKGPNNEAAAVFLK